MKNRTWRVCAMMILAALLLSCGSAAAEPTVQATMAPTVAAQAEANNAPSQASDATTNSAKPWPTNGWQTASPAEQGLDAAKVEAMVQAVSDRRIDLQSLLVVRNGYIVSETYFGRNTPDTTYHLFSVTKSFVATLVGMSIDTGALPDIEQPMLDMLGRTAPDPANEKLQAMRVKDLLTMRTGWAWNESDASYDAMYRSDDWVDFMLRLPMREEPDRRFLYCSGCSHVLAAIVEERTQMPLYSFAQQKLFTPLGIESPRWDVDSQGIPIGGWGLWLTPRDMAKFGYLYLNNGEWDGEQIVSAEWVAESTAIHSRTGGTLDYGYQWWISDSLQGYAAMGRYGQTILVLPEQQMVVVATARIDSHDPIFTLTKEFLIPAVQ
jgi:CubicO group peptidase (beta-lactamase class C family)